MNNQKQQVLLVLLIGVIVAVTAFYEKVSYVEYKPVSPNLYAKVNENAFYVDEKRLTEGHIARLIKILDYLKIDYKLVDGKLYLSEELMSDENKLMNLSVNADSREFFEQSWVPKLAEDEKSGLKNRNELIGL